VHHKKVARQSHGPQAGGTERSYPGVAHEEGQQEELQHVGEEKGHEKAVAVHVERVEPFDRLRHGMHLTVERERQGERNRLNLFIRKGLLH
jgi:hypothetical protein